MTKFDTILAIHLHLNRLITHHTIRYIGRITPFLIISSPSSTTVLEKYTTILHYTPYNRYSLFYHYYAGIVACSAFPTALSDSTTQCAMHSVYNGYWLDVAYCSCLLYYYYTNYSLLYYYYVLYYKDYYYYVTCMLH